MTRRIVVGVDGSAVAERALVWGSAAARANDAELLVAHVADVSLVASPTRDERLSDSHQLLADGVATAFELGVEQASSVLLTGDPAVELLQLTKDALMIIVGSQGAGRIPSILLGSVAFRLAGHADCPVVLVGEHARLPDDPTAPTVVVVAEHDTDSDRKALTFATALAQSFGKYLVVAAASHDALLARAQTAGLLVLGAERDNVHRMNPIHSVASAVLHSARCAVVIVGTKMEPDHARSDSRNISPSS